MLISPPFLLSRQANETEDQWVERCMPGGDPGDGTFPISFSLGWHGGLHLCAPLNGARPATVRAIADGTIAYVRSPAQQPSGPLPPDHAQAYRGGWTDNGVVVIRHETEIGERTSSRVIFFSIYMHLRRVHPAVILNRLISRKGQVGEAGQIYGDTQPKVHFEIVCDDENLRKLMGRPNGPLNVTADGRADALYGEVYIRIPGGTPIYSVRPGDDVTNPASEPVDRTADPLFVGIRYDTGWGTDEDRGSAHVTTYAENGSVVGAVLRELGAEYDLHAAAVRISNAHSAPMRPVPSAVYELLRFGRIIGPEALNPARTPHWRQIRYTGGGVGWVDLNAPGTLKFSDADFPHWKGWSLIDDSQDQDSRCDSPTLKRWLDVNGDGGISPAEARARLQQPSIVRQLARAVCRFVSEWDLDAVSNDRTFNARWGWLKNSTEENPTPISEDDFGRLKAHVAALAFQADGLDRSMWHWPPREFIKHFRKVIWWSESELLRIYPESAQENRAVYRQELGKVCRKYGIAPNLRAAHFFGQAAVESNQLRWMAELFNGDPLNYFRHYERAANFRGWLGNVQRDDGGTYRGRGFKQITGRSNYMQYWVYRGWLDPGTVGGAWWRDARWWGIPGNYVHAQHQNRPAVQDAALVATLLAERRPPIIIGPERAQTDPYTCIDTAGWFWAKNRLFSIAEADDAVRMTNRVRGDRAETADGFPPAAHYPERLRHTRRVHRVVGDAE
ncbi:M23 family metallopeptidase [Aquabacterium sp. A7-Y]|uniref:hydroxyethylthiazole kinase n=1 Tax=Aquabacterium sp. A7-Y TaxID=1349605 RepID=UPI00223D8541|nr:hydroxyethylthiazole kinase [Aquabacterium sp. A7-Y]MCW7538913.1 M23 family metallopeptidase [Aquabacterium sp. A7-Y]